ncbi:MAG: FAD-binding oxidoreductase [Candidatus Pacebacteria bacterium]|jgi:glycine/D-amino acid oxidase-like deaminating enzyme|nr:FAD-binding oxidoreductase [Candidatus Paceibacterota bacterium]
MKTNHSPWLHQLKKDRVSEILRSDIQTEVVIIGAGIAGMATAFFTLKNTDKKVVILERYKLAHGATGHNAGQVTSYFERGFTSIVEEFGLALASSAQKAIEDTWLLLDEIYTDIKSDIPFSRFIGHAGLSNKEQVLQHLKNNSLRRTAKLNIESMIISDTADFLDTIPNEYDGLYTLAPKEEIQSILEAKTTEFIAVLSYQKGCINSALFCQEILFYLEKKYPDRFSLYELTPISKILLRKNEVLLDAGHHTVAAEKIVLCTNGFEGFTIINDGGLEVNTRFHHMLSGTIGYMSGYLEAANKSPTAISYLLNAHKQPTDPYFYLTRRHYDYGDNVQYNLISVGGPDSALENHARYSHEHEYSDEMTKEIDRFVRHIYDIDPKKNIEYIFTWHGLMGYTKNKIRLIGPEPKNSVLLYNLGCNGIGILPSVYGGKRISEFLSGKKMEKSIFDIPVL